MQFSNWIKQFAENVHPEETGFHRAIEENPNDSGRKLIYADWLDEHGHNDLANYIRGIEGMKVHANSFFANRYGDTDHPYAKAHNIMTTSKNRLREKLHNLPFVLYTTPNRELENIYGQSNYRSHDPDYPKLSVSHVRFYHFSHSWSNRPSELNVSVYKAINSDLIDKVIRISSDKESIDLRVSKPTQNADYNYIIQHSPSLTDPEFIKIEIVDSTNERTYKVNNAKSDFSPFIPFSIDPEKGYGKIHIIFNK